MRDQDLHLNNDELQSGINSWYDFYSEMGFVSDFNFSTKVFSDV